MPKLTFTLETISPLFLNGADPRNSPELRAASVRGQLRYWLRAILGARGLSLKEVWDAEEKIFGSTAMGSAVMVRVYSESSPSKIYQYELPHHKNKKEEKSNPNCIAINQKFDLELSTRFGLSLEDDAIKATLTWLLLGGLGKRSRRMFGGLRIQNIEDKNKVLTSDISEILTPEMQTLPYYPELLKKVLPWAVGEYKELAHMPDFPTLHMSHSQILVCTQKFSSNGEVDSAGVVANRTFFRELLRTGIYLEDKSKKEEIKDLVKKRNRISHEDKSQLEQLKQNSQLFNKEMFGYATGGRRASPLIAQLRGSDKEHFIVLTLMRSKLEHSDPALAIERRYANNDDWMLLDAFMKEAAKKFKDQSVPSEFVWGVPFQQEQN